MRKINQMEKMKGFQATKLYSIVSASCPRCHKGDFFETRNPYNLHKFDKMHSHCPSCGQDFEIETGFYYGAMYVSYGLTVGFGLLLYAINRFLLGWDDYRFLWGFPVLILLLTPIFYRMARLIWINFFVSYKS